MPFGMHQGAKLDEVPRSYLQWMVTRCDRVWPETRRLIERYLAMK